MIFPYSLSNNVDLTSYPLYALVPKRLDHNRAVPDTYTVHQTQLALIIFLTADQNQKQYSTVW